MHSCKSNYHTITITTAPVPVGTCCDCEMQNSNNVPLPNFVSMCNVGQFLLFIYIHILQYSQRHSVINHCDKYITHLGDLDISFVLLNISSKFLLHLECYLISPKRHIKIRKQIKQTKRYISTCITKQSDTSITVIYHTMSMTKCCMITFQFF